MWEITSSSAEETQKISFQLGRLLFPGAVLALRGLLGVGKTTFTQGVAEGLEVEDYVSSPSYTLINEYKGRLIVYHIDLYRIDNPVEIYELGYQDCLRGDGVVIIEWADKIFSLLPENLLWVELKEDFQKERKQGLAPEANFLNIKFEAQGDKYMNLLNKFKVQCRKEGMHSDLD